MSLPRRRCDYCGAPLEGTRRGRLYCSSRCRQAAYRERQGVGELARLRARLRRRSA